jgi:glycosidase
MEAGDASENPGDLAKRTPMDWDAVDRENADASSLLNAYRALAKIRAAHPALSSGVIESVQALDDQGMAWIRRDPKTSETVLVAVNFGANPISAQSIGLGSISCSEAEILYGQASVSPCMNASLGLKALPPKQGTWILLR